MKPTPDIVPDGEHHEQTLAETVANLPVEPEQPPTADLRRFKRAVGEAAGAIGTGILVSDGQGAHGRSVLDRQRKLDRIREIARKKGKKR